MTEVDSVPRGHPGPMQSDSPDPDRELEALLQKEQDGEKQDQPDSVPPRSHTPAGKKLQNNYPTSFPSQQNVDEEDDDIDRYAGPVSVGGGEDSGDDGDYDGEMTADQKMAMGELHDMRLDLGYADEDPPDYDVKERVRQLNEELAKEPLPPEHERSIKFNENPVSLVVPPPEYPSDEEPDDTNEILSKPATVSQSNQSQGQATSPSTLAPEGQGESKSNMEVMESEDDSRTQGRVQFEEQEVIDSDNEEHQTGKSSDVVSDKMSDAGSDKGSEKGSENGETRTEEQNKGDDEKVLVERNNKFELVSINTLSAEEREMYLPSEETKDSQSTSSKASSEKSGDGGTGGGYSPQPPRNPRPATATATSRSRSSPQQNTPSRGRRVQSAKPRSNTASNPNAFDDSDFNYRSPYALTDQEKKQLRRQKSAKEDRQKKKEEDEKDKKKHEQEEADDAFQAWLKQKRRDASLRRKQENEQRKKDKEEEENNDENSSVSDTSSKRDPDSAFKEWLQVKEQEKKRTRSVERAIRREQQEQVTLRPRSECDKAFKQWLRKKNAELRRQKMDELSRNRVARLMARRSRKSQQLAQAMTHAQAFKYVDYYGYRF